MPYRYRILQNAKGLHFFGLALWTVLCMYGSGSWAEKILTWQDCLKLVVDHNPDLAAAISNAKNYDALYGASASNFFPQLSFSAGYTDSSVSGTVPTPGSLTQVVTVQNQYTEALSLNQSLFNGFTDVGKVRQGKANFAAAVAQVDLEKVTLNSTLKLAFAQLLFEQKSVELTAAILQRQQTNLRMIDLRFRGGNENKGNLLFQEATVAQAKYQYEHAQRQLRNAVKQLGALWGEPDIDGIRVVGELAGHITPNLPDFATIAAQHPNHVNYVELKRAADAGITVADGAWYPNLNLVGSVGKVGSEWPPDNSRWSVGVALTFPFFPGTSTYYNARSARALDQQADEQLHSTDFKLIAALESNYEGLLDAVAQVDVNQQFLHAAIERSKIANGKYNTGLMTFEDWTLIDQDLVSREQNLLQSQLNAMQAEASWENAAGLRSFQ